MTKETLTKFTRSLKGTVTKRSPEILTGIGIAGMITSVFLAGKATVKAVRIADGLDHIDRNTYDVVSPTKKEVIKACWKLYIPAALTATASTACLIGASSVNLKRNAAITAAYKLSETALAEYKDAVVETIGEKKEKVVKEKVAKKQIEKKPLNSGNVIVTDRGSVLFFDPISARYFKSDMNTIKSAENAINKSILSSAFTDGASLNDFYDEIGIPHSSVGDDMGWNVDNLLEIYCFSQIAGKETEYEGTPCIVLDYVNPPKYDYC